MKRMPNPHEYPRKLSSSCTLTPFSLTPFSPDSKTGAIGLGRGGHFDGAAEAGMSSISSATHKGITTFEKNGNVFWANDSMSFARGVTNSEAANIQKALQRQFTDQSVTRLTDISQAFK
jgi:hypothetical protein